MTSVASVATTTARNPTRPIVGDMYRWMSHTELSSSVSTCTGSGATASMTSAYALARSHRLMATAATSQHAVVEQRHVECDEREEQRGGVRQVHAMPSAVRGVCELASPGLAWVRHDGGRRGEHESARGEEQQARAQKQEHGGEHPLLGDAVHDEGVHEARREHGGPAKEREAERLGGGGQEPREEGEQEAGATERRAEVEDAA
uniref:Uncharacterized protein n=1 Tax=Setaria viridis TaxID=4556 RepID=A0A4V6DBM9_SETVI|nr:hypothetical protein SEVIR_4G133301v2 [Setaria viridis]